MSEATTITIGVVDCEDLSPTGVFRVNENTPFRKVMDTWERQHGRCDDNVMYFFDGMRVAHSDTPRNLHMVDGDELLATRQAVGGKPVIYLFSPKDIRVRVRMTLIPQWELSAVYPVVPIKITSSGEEIEWTVTAHPDGSLTEVSSGLDIYYLFWEAQSVMPSKL